MVDGWGGKEEVKLGEVVSSKETGTLGQMTASLSVLVFYSLTTPSTMLLLTPVLPSAVALQ